MDWLSELLRRIQEQKLKQEETIQCLKQLYKPWPVHKEPEDSKQGKQSSLNTDSATNAQAQDEGDSSLTAEEKEGLLLMDKLLSKAQKTREIQKKLEEPKKSRVKQVVQPKTKDDTTSKNCSSSSVTTKSSEAERSVSENNVSDKGARAAAGRAQVSIKQAVPSKPKPVNKVIGRSGAKTTEKTERSRISNRPQSGPGNRKALPVHASAPFQTNPNLTSSKLQTTYRAATAKTLAKSRSATTSVRSKLHEPKNSTRVSTKSATSSCSQNIKGRESKEIQEREENKETRECSYSSENSEHHEEERNDCKTDEDSFQNKLQAMTVNESSVQEAEVTCEGYDDKPGPKPFDLWKDGATLSVPNKLKKLMYQNRKLRQKLYTQNVTQKVSSPQAAVGFPEHLQHSIQFGDEDARVTRLQAKQAEHIVHTYNSLLHLLDSLHLDRISADSDPTDIHYCKKMVEYILLTFQETEQLLHTTDFSNLNSARIYSGCPIPKLPVTEPSSMLVWYDKNTSAGDHSKPAVYQYHSYKQLETYMSLVFKVQLLQLQIDVMDTVARLLLPLLKTLDPDTSEFAQVLRAAYSLLSVNHNHMPVVVKDTIQEDSGIQDHEDET